MNTGSKLGNLQAEKRGISRSITSVADLESILGLKEGIAEVLEVNNGGQEFDDSDATKEFNITFSFAFFIAVLLVTGAIYIRLLSPTGAEVRQIISKFTYNNYSIPPYAAERYLTWYGMRTFFFGLHYVLTILGIIASLMTVFYASSKMIVTRDGVKKVESNKIVFLSLLSLSFSMSSVFINAGTQANMAQHAWRELDICIMHTIQTDNLTGHEKDQLIVGKIAEMEHFIETFEH